MFSKDVPPSTELFSLFYFYFYFGQQELSISLCNIAIFVLNSYFCFIFGITYLPIILFEQTIKSKQKIKSIGLKF